MSLDFRNLDPTESSACPPWNAQKKMQIEAHYTIDICEKGIPPRLSAHI